ncbi:tetratricopeptide repeat protein [Actinocorallia sp. API 0066]|uniref:tetratricopeptide repeat protein n=1 Tax=Actinocorallia sp. API 0066 TaxID=2896846 RepID=UPI001E33E3FB|nr:tetratricopeptide repeat protein [Actinocorallia sp. API 0066]MCD0449934.1 tetratricopeptide repeat protein [Actinocorallia sp. API 0066]
MSLAQARQMAETGDLTGAAGLFSEALASDVPAERAEAALGLAVVLEDLGDTEGARRADWTAIETGDPEYAPRAAYHLALSHERAGEPAEASEAWHIVASSGHAAYTPAACLALAQLADDAADPEAAVTWWERVIETGDPEYAPVAAHDLAQHLLDAGRTAAAQRVLAETLRTLTPDTYAYARLATLMGLAHLDQAIGAFTAAVDATTAPDVTPLAVELLARTLRLRARDTEAEAVWSRALSDPALHAQVTARLQRPAP